ncbi:MAG: TolC family outer membrane protein [Methylobacterium sp.]|nr:TolC family outer membrane protein [Methylobacterium sp.]MCA3606900.1 TolC family outer membrane protein [Methylobacterium sp.]MCA3609808.1 TolC family outer membrane protein [Methylobacterium sp.]MCA3617042.1 TolC family outer membrane protein [Methylobacterium sp.]MCA3622122.1 TolC family outer membrane protein [Methylobacterium sp.]
MRRASVLAFGLMLAVSPLALSSASAQSLEAALSSAYRSNPDLNATRANLRSVNENIASAMSGYRPRVTGSADYGISVTDSRSPGRQNTTNLNPAGLGLSVSQTLYNGGRTGNSVRAAESGVLGSRETLRNSEQNTLLDAVTAYMNVLRDTAILSLRQNNVNVLAEQVRQTKDRFAVGEVTRTDVAQAEARLAGSRSELAISQSNLRGSVARFKQVTGMEPKKLSPVQPVTAARLPNSQGEAVNRALRDHPAIAAALHGVDAQQLQVKVVEGELLPTITLTGSLARRFDSQVPDDRRNSASVVGAVSIPFYDGGSAYARSRQAKETLGERRMQVDSARDRVVAAVIASWALMEATKFQIEGAAAQVQAAEIALNGVREEYKVGQRTTLDVLNAQQELLNARVAQVTAQRDRVVASYSVLSSIGQLSARSLGLKVSIYDPKVHTEQVQDKWFGLRTPSGE